MTNQVEENLKERGALLMKQYQDVLIILGENATAQSKFNKLLKIQTKTVDKQLAYLIDEVRKAYNYYVPPRSSRRVELGSGIPSNHGEYLEYLMPRREGLREYVEDVLHLTQDISAYAVFEDRIRSLLDRWSKFKKKHPERVNIDAECINGFLLEVNDGYTRGLIEEAYKK